MTEAYPFAFTVEAFERGEQLNKADQHFMATLKRCKTHCQLLNRLQAETELRASADLWALQAALRAQFLLSLLADMLCLESGGEYLLQSPAFLRASAAVFGILEFFQYIYRAGVLQRVDLRSLFSQGGAADLLGKITCKTPQMSLAAPVPAYALVEVQDLLERFESEILRQLTRQVGGDLPQIMESDFRNAFRAEGGMRRPKASGDFSPARYFENKEAADPVSCQELCRICFHLTDVELARMRFLVDAIAVAAIFRVEMQEFRPTNGRMQLFLFSVRQTLEKILFHFEFVCSQRLSINESFQNVFVQVSQQKHFIKIFDILLQLRPQLDFEQLVALRTELNCVIEDFRRASTECGCFSWL